MSTRNVVTVAAIGFAAMGLALLFAPDEVGSALYRDTGGPLMQLLGAALLGFASMNWMARGAALGGIYGRAVVAANQVHTTIGALVLIRQALAAGGSPVFWAVTACYVAAALFFSYLAFFSSGLNGRVTR